MSTISPIDVSQEISETYTRYLKSLIRPDNVSILDALEHEIDQALTGPGGMVKGPFFELTPSYQHSLSSRDLMERGELAPAFGKLESEVFSLDRHWYTHQVNTLRQLNLGRNVVVATGTGSGKTESFVLPILNSILSESAEEAQHSGVRALLLYPMNALANDQLKRLRQILKSCPDITFGRYTGETLQDREAATNEFRALHHGEAPLRSELLSRAEMQKRPPHILLTNYAMLEYLLLRPDDSTLFGDAANSTWKFIVVDEAHMYDGAIGAEIGYLIRRLRSRVTQNDQLQCIATSATLGSDKATAAKFATDLFGVPFDGDRGDIISATPKSDPGTPVWGSLPANILDSDQSPTEPFDVLPDPGSQFQSFYDLLASEGTIRELIAIARQKPKTLRELRSQLSRQDLTESQLHRLIDLASKTLDSDGTPLIAGKYHLFARATEGAFTCLNPAGPHVSLARHDKCPECSWLMLELAACQRCGGVHFVGTSTKTSGASYIGAKESEGDRTVWISLKKDQHVAIDEDDLTLEGQHGKDPKEVGFCPKCGKLETTNRTTCSDSACGTPLLQVVQHFSTALERCLRCGAASKRIIRRFESGNDAAASVLTTSLYQSLPEATSGEVDTQYPGGGRKLLVFSDSRQQAAFFAPYLENTYERFVQRRFIYQAICDPIFSDEPASSSDIADLTMRLAARAGYFSEDESASKRRITTATWVQAEMVTLDQRISLEGSGLVKWEMKRPVSLEALRPLQSFGFDEQESIALLQLLVRSLRLQGAVGSMDYVDPKDDIFAPRLGPIRIRSTGADASKKILSWLPSQASSGSSNTRSDFLNRLLIASRLSPSETTSILEGLWKVLTHVGSPFHNWLREETSPQLGTTWTIDPERIMATPVAAGQDVWCCNRCGTTSYHNVRGICPRYRCSGRLEAVPENEDNHYRHLYRTLLPIPLAAKEHTAQWTSKEAAFIQQEFTKGKVNILSCSTTFELGVDVGDLQAVVLRNVPPTVSNYTQRSGRAGRRSGTAALVLTYAQRRSHDLSVFANPSSQIGANVRTPVVPIRNPRLARRHFNSVGLAAYWKQVALSSGLRYQTVDQFFSTSAPDGTSAAGEVKDWLDSHHISVERDIRRLVGRTELSASDWDWNDWTSALQSLLDEVEQEYQAEITLYEELAQSAYSEQKGKKGDYFNRVLNTLRKRPLLGFLANRNVIPKYGFPVDTVEFKIPLDGTLASKLDLARDLSQAIFEYAPGAEIVAGGQLWRSTGITRQREKEHPEVFYRICPECDSYTESLVENHDPCACGAKGSKYQAKYFEPRFGFVANKTPEKPGDAAPRVSWRGETRIARDGEVVSRDNIETPGGVVSFEVMERVELVRLNPGPADLGFKVCGYCGFALPATKEWPRSHEDPIRGKPCSGYASTFSLAHKYETDVVRIAFPFPWNGASPRSTSLSVLHAVLQGAASSLQIAGANIDGAVTSYHTTAPTIDIVDTVPGGAGYARLIGSALGSVLRAALQVVETCECGPETSCSMCLRTYANQRNHEELVRGAAAEYLAKLYH